MGRPIPGSRITSYLYQYRNVPGTTLTQGFELQGSYDTGVGFGRVAYSNILTSLPGGQALAAGGGAIPTTPPRNVFSGTLGARFFEQRFTVGTRIRLASATNTAGASTAITNVPGYTAVDFFTSLRVADGVKLFANMENIGNANYRTDILSNTYAPGFTALFGVTIALSR
jgi:hemoglobin/transferrin/lactoferrin receptor protein